MTAWLIIALLVLAGLLVAAVAWGISQRRQLVRSLKDLDGARIDLAASKKTCRELYAEGDRLVKELGAVRRQAEVSRVQNMSPSQLAAAVDRVAAGGELEPAGGARAAGSPGPRG